MAPAVEKKNQRFGKAYRICSKIEIDKLFAEGEKLYKFPFSIHFLKHDDKTSTAFQVVTSVPKRLFKHAVKRNRIKRQIKECIRKNKYILEAALQQKQLNLRLFIVYTAKEEMDSETLERKTAAILTELTQKF